MFKVAISKALKRKGMVGTQPTAETNYYEFKVIFKNGILTNKQKHNTNNEALSGRIIIGAVSSPQPKQTNKRSQTK